MSGLHSVGIWSSSSWLILVPMLGFGWFGLAVGCMCCAWPIFDFACCSTVYAFRSKWVFICGSVARIANYGCNHRCCWLCLAGHDALWCAGSIFKI